MSLDTIAIFDVTSPIDPFDLLARVAKEPALAELVPRFGPLWTVDEWRAEPSATDPRVVDLLGPGGLVLRLGRRSLEVYHVLRFGSFAAAGEDQRLVRRAFRAIARLVGSERALYTHELAPTDRDPDEGVDAVITNLSATVGPPARTFAELAQAQPHRARSWYVDTFGDLAAN